MALIFALNVSAAFAAGISNSVNNFGWNYYKTLDKDENIFYSPYSIAAALSMLSNGAIGRTKQEILDALYSDSIKNLNDGFANFHGVNSANLLLIDKKYSGNGINSRFKNKVEKIYGSEVAIADFENNLTGEKARITDWVKKHTNNFIPNYKSIARQDTAVDLLNVIYFKEDWLDAFYQSDTRQKNFFNKDGSISKVDMMNRIFEDKISYYADEKYRGVELPYKNSNAALFIILPVDEDNLNIADDWNAENISYCEDFLNKIQTAPLFDGEVHLALPKFELDIKNNLVEKLWQVGIQRAFTDYAEFYNIINGVSLKIDDAAHQAKIKVDEQGTEAAAVTEITMVETTAMAPDFKSIVKFRADIPFVFVIRDIPSKINLFTGTINTLE